MAEFDLTQVNKARQGDAAAFRRLLTEHYTMMYRVAYRYTGNKQDAEDIAQEVCLQLAGKLASFKGESGFSTWLYKIVLNSCRDMVKVRANRRVLNQSYLELEKQQVADAQESSRKVAWLYRAIGGLDEPLKETALLVLAEELSHAEAAIVLKCAESTISWRMHEVRKLLKAKISTYP